MIRTLIFVTGQIEELGPNVMRLKGNEGKTIDGAFSGSMNNYY